MIQVLSCCEDSPGRLWQVRSGPGLLHGPGLGFVALCHAHEGSLITLSRIWRQTLWDWGLHLSHSAIAVPGSATGTWSVLKGWSQEACFWWVTERGLGQSDCYWAWEHTTLSFVPFLWCGWDSPSFSASSPHGSRAGLPGCQDAATSAFPSENSSQSDQGDSQPAADLTLSARSGQLAWECWRSETCTLLSRYHCFEKIAYDEERLFIVSGGTLKQQSAGLLGGSVS